MVSIIIPIYNVEKYLNQCLESIFNQTFKNIEVIIVDDGSTDNSHKIVKKFKEKYSNIIYLSQSNRGVSAARNLGLKYASGKYVLFVDPDDYLDLTMIEKMYKKIISTNSDIVICGYKAIYDDTIEGSDKDVIFNRISDKEYTGIDVGNMMLEGSVRGFLWDKLFNKIHLNKYKFILEEGRYVQDWYPVFIQVVNAKKISFINEPLYKYRQRGTSTVNKKTEKLLNDYIYATSNILDYIETKNLKINKKNINKFKVIRFLGCIGYYSNLKNNSKNMYLDFKNSEYKKYNISFKEVIKVQEIKMILKYIAWKLKIYHLLF